MPMAANANSLDQLILHDLPVIRAGATFVDEIPAIEIPILKDGVALIFPVKNGLDRQLDGLFRLHFFNHVYLELDVLDRSETVQVVIEFILDVSLRIILPPFDLQSETRDIARVPIGLQHPTAAPWRGIVV